MTLELGPATREEFELPHVLQFVGRKPVEDDHVEAGAAVVGEDLDRHDVAHPVDASELAFIVLGQVAGGGAEFVGLKDDQSPLGVLPASEVGHSLLDGSDEAEDEQGDRRPADG